MNQRLQPTRRKPTGLNMRVLPLRRTAFATTHAHDANAQLLRTLTVSATLLWDT
ncbi:hypothetical protein NHJ6243_009129 [Beauveria neobassiana]